MKYDDSKTTGNSCGTRKGAAARVRPHATLILLLLVALMFGFLRDADASGGIRTIRGLIGARGAVLGEHGKPVWVEYDQNGEVARIIGEAVEELADARAVSKKAYLSRFESLGLTPDPTVASSTRSDLVGPSWEVMAASENDIGYLAAFYTPAGADPLATAEGRSSMFGCERGDTLWAPVDGAGIGAFASLGGSVSKNGVFAHSYLIPGCVGTSFMYAHHMYAGLSYSQFNPRRRLPAVYYVRHRLYDHCTGLSENMHAWSLQTAATKIATTAVEAPIEASQRLRDKNVSVDLAMLAGEAVLANERRAVGEGDDDAFSIGLDPQAEGIVPRGPTTYLYEKPAFEETIMYNLDTDGDGVYDAFDLDGDGVEDTAILGPENPENPDDPDSKNIVRIWLDTNNPDEDPPDCVRLPDTLPDIFDRGLLASVDAKDLKTTDMLVYRLSNERLIAGRTGLYDYEISGDSDSLLNYRFLFRGPASFIDPAAEDIVSFQSKTLLDPELYGADADRVRPGERLEVVLINRATGYVGTAVAAFPERIDGADVSVHPEKIVMRPPNLEIEAERQYTVEQGLTRDETRNYIVGFEGAGLETDEYIKLTTRWYDWDGSPLPADPDFPGYTARIAKIAVPEGDKPADRLCKISEFPIKPGTHTQFVALSGTDLETAHFYIHVSGAPEKWDPFSSDAGPAVGPGEAPLEERPIHYVPIKVPVYDEVATLEARRSDEDAPPVYRRVYRPEMRFSVLDLEGPKLLRTDATGETDDILDDKIPAISTSDLEIEFDYTLLQGDFDPLDPLGPGENAAIAAGADEYEATFSESEQCLELDLDRLESLDSEGFLALRLYRSHDPENILWEFAFLELALLPSESLDDDEPIEISADESQAIVSAILLDDASGENGEARTIEWEVEGEGSVSPVSETNEFGGFSTTLSLPTTAGATARVVARLSDGSSLGFRTPWYKVVPGRPASIEIQTDGDTAIGGLGGVEVALTVRDRFGNPVADGTPVSIDVPDVRVETEGATVEGRLSATLTGMERAGTKEMTVTAGETAVPAEIYVHDVDFDWEIPSGLSTDRTVAVKLKASSSYGDLEGLEVRATAFRGRLEDDVLTIRNGEASTRYHTGPFRGEAQLYARVGASADYTPFYVEESVRDAVFSESVIVADVVEDGAFDVVDEEVGEIPVAYSAHSILELSGIPGETRQVSLGTVARPIGEPVARYAMDEVGSDGAVIDTFQGLDAESVGVEVVSDHPEGFGESFEFDGTAFVRAPLDDAFDRPGDIGFGFWFKPSGFDVPLVDYAVRGMNLDVDSEGRLVFSAATTDGVYAVESDPLAPGEWHLVGAAFKEGALFLEIDGDLRTTPASGSLVRDPSAACAMVVGAGFQGGMSDFAVNDWTAPALLAFDDGSTRATAVLDQNGKAYLNVGSTGSMTSRGELRMRRIERYLARRDAPFSIPCAFGADLPAFCDESPPESWFGVEALEFLFDYLDKCYLADRMRKARVRIEGADGIREKILGYMDLAKFKAVSAAVVKARSVVTVANCVDGFVLGGNQSGAGMVCDFISGFFAYGDIRDFVFHFYYFHFGDEGKFDQATYTLAGLGIVTNLLQVGGFFGGGVPGVVMSGADAAVGGAKMAAKIFRAGGKSTKYLNLLADFLSRSVMEAPDLKKKAEALAKVMPVLELTAMVAFYYKDFGDIVQLLIAMVKTESAFMDFAEYLYGFFVWAEDHPDEYAAEFETETGPLGIESAYAGTPVVRQSVRQAIFLLRFLKKNADKLKLDEEELCRMISQLQLAKKPPINEGLIQDMYKAPILQSFLNVDAVSREAALKLKSFTYSPGVDMPELHLDISELPIVELLENEDIAKGLSKVFNNLGHPAFIMRQGSAHEVHLIHYFKKNGKTLKGVQDKRIIEYEIVKPNGEIKKVPLGERTYDSVIEMEIGDQTVEILYDSKSWAWGDNGAPVRDKIAKFLKFNDKGEKGGTYGQLFKDICYVVQGKEVRWAFDTRCAGRENEIVGIILDELKKNEKAKEEMYKILYVQIQRSGYEPSQMDKWISDVLKEEMADFVEVIPARQS